AIQDYPELQLATWELERPGPTYTLDTLHFLRAEVYPLPTPLTIIMGADTFLQLPTWHDWSHLIQLAHFLVIYRETSLAFPLVLRELLIKHETRDPSELLQQSHGRIYCTHAGDYPIASRNIRQTIQQGDSPAEYLPPKVWEYIQKNGLYR
ncbi:MAG: nicotinate-nicotinamide nucleotide adenylyltransferase, partial [Legionellaceae bacterium]|nr:nicotinate-nicotinamide nucleotide adenylyltransferase [Legionellaceae bacterium]